MRYRSVADLAGDLRSNMHRLPKDIDLVVGIPRSGMLPASLIALALNLPLSDLESFAAGRAFASGHTRRRAALALEPAAARHVLVVDDSAYSGASLRQARTALSGVSPDVRMTFAVVYAPRDVHPDADVVLLPIPMPRVFEWNVMHHRVLERSCVDIDGILCHDPTPEENDDGPRYAAFLASARPMVIPTKRIHTLVTSRLEQHRPQTQAWLSSHGIEYDRLEMLDLPDAETRRRLGAHAPFKADVYRRSSAELFIESEPAQAEAIARRSGKDVLCLTNHTVYQPGRLSPAAAEQRLRRSAKLARRARGLLRRRWKALLSATARP